MILTSCRVICVNKKNSAFKAFDLPLSLISNEGFAQPIFGANYIHGTCKPLLNSLPGDINFKIWFMTGGCGTFAPAYLKMVASCKRNRGRGAEQSVINSYQNAGQRKTAYIDPNDPSVIYLQQPEVAQNINYNPFGQYQPIPQGPPMQVGPQQPPYHPQQPPYQPQQPPYQPQQPPYQPQQPPYQPQQPPYQPQQPPYQPQQPPYHPQQPMIEKPMHNQQPVNDSPAPQGPYPPPNNNYPNYPGHNPINNPPEMNNQQNGLYMMPPNVGNNVNNNYPNFGQNNNINQAGENDLPSQEEIYSNSQSNQNMYPNQGMEGLNGVIDNNQNQQGGAKYFGFWGPSLNRNPNQDNNNGH